MAQGRDKRGKLLETPIQSQILENLTVRGIFCWRSQPTPVPIRRGRQIVGIRKVDPKLKGMPDIMAIYAGKFYAIEVKRQAGGKQTEDQERWEMNIRKAGGAYVLARSWNEAALSLIQYGLPLADGNRPL